MTHKKNTSARVIVGMSGGVDSSVAAYLLKEQGYQVEGLFMKNWEEEETEGPCPAAADTADAQAVCEKLAIPFHQVNFADTYWECVFTHFLSEHRAGRTPNPDILCNKEIKFRAFLDYAKQLGADFIATGHYAKRLQIKDTTYLLKAHDKQKDQSYFLHALNETQLNQSLFPLSDLLKTTVRQLAKVLGFNNHAKKDSVGICFIGEHKFKAFLKNYLPAQPGNIETVEGETIGTHDGLMFYTLGQRQGLQIGGRTGKLGCPWYVAKKDLARNTLIVVQGKTHPHLFQTSLIASDIHWINRLPLFPLTAMAKTRYRQTDQACVIEKIEGNRYQVKFSSPQRAITPGQSIVFYQDEICLGGGIIIEQ